MNFLISLDQGILGFFERFSWWVERHTGHDHRFLAFVCGIIGLAVYIPLLIFDGRMYGDEIFLSIKWAMIGIIVVSLVMHFVMRFVANNIANAAGFDPVAINTDVGLVFVRNLILFLYILMNGFVVGEWYQNYSQISAGFIGKDFIFAQLPVGLHAGEQATFLFILCMLYFIPCRLGSETERLG